MNNNRTQDQGDYVKKQTLLWAVISSLMIGFLAGSIYSSYRLAPSGPGVETPQAQAQIDRSAEFGAKILELEQFLKKNPNDAEAWAQLGHLFFDTDQHENAIDAYQKSLDLAPGNPAVLTDLGVMYRRNEQPELAVETFDRAIQADPKFETARFNKGVVLLHDLNDLKGGLKAWEDLVEINPLAVAPNGESVDAIVKRMRAQAEK